MQNKGQRLSPKLVMMGRERGSYGKGKSCTHDRFTSRARTDLAYLESGRNDKVYYTYSSWARCIQDYQADGELTTALTHRTRRLLRLESDAYSSTVLMEYYRMMAAL